MSRNTGLLTTQCDPYGIESSIRLFGGQYPESMMGKHVWYCGEPADAGTFRLICTGGEYGRRMAPDGGIVPAFTCEGGHKGPPMPLCKSHQRELSTTGYMKPRPSRTAWHDGNGREQHWEPGSVVGGAKANEMCPTCVNANGARELNEQAGYLSGQIGLYMQMGLELSSPAMQLRQQLEGVRARLDELNLTGRSHKCPLRLVEVS